MKEKVITQKIKEGKPSEKEPVEKPLKGKVSKIPTLKGVVHEDGL